MAVTSSVVAGAPQDPQFEAIEHLRDENATANAAADWAAGTEPTADPAHPQDPATPAPTSRTARARAQAEQLRRRADDTVKGLEAKRPANRWIDAGFSTFERDVSSGGGVLAAALVLIASILGIVLFGAWTSKLEDRVGILGLIPMLLAGVVFAGVWTFVQYHLPRADVHWTKLIPGSVLVAVGVEGLQIVTVVWFTRYIESKSETYGAIGAALAILLWAYFLGRIVVSGAMLNAALYEQEQRGRPGAAPPRS